jgi:hypothetical protein
MIAELVYDCTFWLHNLPNEVVVSKVFISRTIITRFNLDNVKYFKLEFVEYVQTHRKHDET